MMKGGLLVLCSLTILVVLSSAVYAADEVSDVAKVSKAQQCIDDLIKDKKSSEIGFQDAVFSMLALGSRQNLIEAIDSEKKGDESCWPKSSCKIKDSSQVLLAYRGAGKISEDIKKWIIGKNISVNGLSWYLQIDIENQEKSACTVSYDSQNVNLNIDEKAKITGTTGSCLDVSSNGYWLTVRRTCQDKTFGISCDKNFITSILYQKGSDGTVYVSNDATSSAAGGSNEEKIEGKCLGAGTSCDYEGTLWGALALKKSGIDVSNLMPYLTAFAEDNKKYFPSAFIYILSGGDNYFSEIVQSQSQSKYWQMAGTPYNKFYDTSLGMLSLGGTSSTELSNAKSYMLSIQEENGCWNNNNIRDSSFLLYSGWRSGTFSGNGSLGGGGGGTVTCENAGYSCGTSAECRDAGGEILYNYDCSENGYGMSCCGEQIQEESCSEKGGIICSAGQSCSGNSESASDGSCCMDACLNDEQETQCEIDGGICANSCNSGEEDTGANCEPSSNQLCCVEKTGSLLWLWIIILLILIALVTLAIIYRQKLILWWHSRKFRAKGTPIIRPASPGQQPEGFFQNPFSTRARTPQRAPRRDSEFEETLKKLKEMSK